MTPEGPWHLPADAWPATLRRTGRQFMEDNLIQWAGSLAFFMALSLFPSLLALVSVLGLIGAPAIEPLIQNLGELAPSTARDIALDGLRAVQDNGGGAGLALVIGLLVALWSASAYVGAFIPAANVVWEMRDERPLWSKLRVRVGLTLLLLFLIALIGLTVVLTGPIAREIGGIVGLGDEAVDVWDVAKWPFLGCAVMVLIGTLYWVAPNVRHPGWRWITPGSVLALLVWIIASLGFTFYVSNFGSYNETYGGIGGVLVFLLWLWLTNIAILLGAELNAEIARTRAIEAGMRPEDKTPFLPPKETG
jgi:membrane protein